MPDTAGAIESAVIAYLKAECTTAGETATVDGHIPDKGTRYITVKRTGGVRENPRRDSALLEFGCFAATEDAARALADFVRERIWALKPVNAWVNGATISGLTVYRITEVGGPVNSPYSPSHPPRYRFSEQLDYRM
jgi:hypothetical protein